MRYPNSLELRFQLQHCWKDLLNFDMKYLINNRSLKAEIWWRYVLDVISGAKTRRGILAVSPPIVWEWSTSASPPTFWMDVHLSVNVGKKVSDLFSLKTIFFFYFGLHLNLGGKCVLFLMTTFFFLVFTWIWGKKVFHLHFIFGLHYISTPEQNRRRGSSPPMLKIGQNWGKIANYPPNAQQRSAPLDVM